MKKISLFLALLLPAAGLRAEIDPLKRVAAELADGLGVRRSGKLAVLAIPYYDRHTSDGPFLVSERLSAYLCKDKRLAILERNHIVQVLNELHLSETGVLNAAAAHRLGQMLGADIIITGTLIDLDSHKTELNARAVLADNGRVVAASRAVVDQTWARRRILAW